MTVIYSYVSPLIPGISSLDITSDSEFVPMLSSATRHQISVNALDAASGIVDISVKYLGSNDFELLLIDGVVQTIDLSAIETIQNIPGVVSAFRFDSADADGSWCAAMIGWSAAEPDAVDVENNTQDIEYLIDNVRDVVFIDMLGGDYVLPVHEARAAVKVLINGVTGSTLTWPTTSDGQCAATCMIYNYNLAGVDILLACETGGAAAMVRGSTIDEFIVKPGVGVFSMGAFTAEIAQSYHKATVIKGTSDDLTADAIGAYCIMNVATPNALTILPSTDPGGDMGNNAQTRVYVMGAGTTTITPGLGVTLIGTAAIPQYSSRILAREGTTETWYII